MPFFISTDDVKAKLGIASSDTTWDSKISDIVSEYSPVVENAIDPSFLVVVNTNEYLTLVAAYNEIICGEVQHLIWREPGAMDLVNIGDLQLTPPGLTKLQFLDMRAIGWARLKPFLKKEMAYFPSQVSSIGGKGFEEGE